MERRMTANRAEAHDLQPLRVPAVPAEELCRRLSENPSVTPYE